MAREATVRDGRVQFSMHFTEAEYDQLIELAETEGRSKRDIIRRALEQYYKRRMR